MQLQHYCDGQGFLDAAGQYLYRDEVINGILIGVAGAAAEHTAEGHTPYLATLDEGGHVCGAAVMTPPHRLLVNLDSQHRQDGVRYLAEDLRSAGRTLPGVTGLRDVADAFAATWAMTNSFQLRRGTAMMVFELRQVSRPVGVAGQSRWATTADIEWLVEWMAAFNEEVHQTPRPGPTDLRAWTRRKIERQEFLVWEDEGEPVSVAGRSRPSPTGAAISYVRTPEPFRRRGYASACVAELSQRILDDGKLFCTLFTDLANPTSNHIYQEIGYQARGQFVELHFDM